MEDKASLEATSHKEKPEGFLGKKGVWEANIDEARTANAHDHDLTVRQALRAYPYAVLWSLGVSMSVIMEGYDTILIGSLYAYPTYARAFGAPDSSGDYQIPARWQSAMGSGPQAGAIVGAFFNGMLIQRFGYRPSFILGMVLMLAFVFVSFFGMSVELQAVGQILCGVPWGIFATIGPAYASEVCPMTLRPYLTAYTNMCFATGQLIGAGVLQSFLNRPDNFAWRIPFAIQWLWPPFLLVAAIFMPESPWWLVRHGRYEHAEKVVRRLMARPELPRAHAVVVNMVYTNNLEQEITGGVSYLDCFKGVDLRRTEIACVTFLGQITCGAQFAYSSTYFFTQAGLSSDDSYKLNLGGTGIAFIGTAVSWSLMRYVGRRHLYMTGMAFMCLFLFIIGCLTLSHNSSVKWAQSALCIIWLLTFSLTVGPVGWAIPAEVSSTRLRSKTIVLARNAYYIAQIVANVIEPYMMNPVAWNWKGFTGFFWFGFGFITLIWAFFRLPESKGRSFSDLDVMFTAKVPTRKFQNFRVDAYDESRAVSGRATEIMSGSHRTMIASKACDGCRLRKAKCDMIPASAPPDSTAPYQLRDPLTAPRCRRCTRLDLSCTFDKPTKHRGPRRRSREKPEDQNMAATVMATTPGRMDSMFIEPNPFTPESNPGSFSSRPTMTYPTDRLCARPLLLMIVDDYLRFVYPLVPVVHRPSFRRDLMNDRDVDDKVFLGLLMAICSITVGLLPSRFSVYRTWNPGPPLRFERREEMMNYCYECVIRLRGPRYFDEINSQKLAISYVMSIAFFQLGDQNTARMMEVEAMQLGRLLQVHKISEYADLDCIEAQLRKKGFWLLFYAYVHSELQNLRKERLSFLDPILLDSINLEELLPLDVDDEQILEDAVLPSEQPGTPCLTTAFIIHSRVFWAALRSTRPTTAASAAQEEQCICKKWRNLAANIVHLRGRLQELKYMLDVLPDQLLPWAPGTGRDAILSAPAATLLPLNDSSTDIIQRQFSALRANLHVTHLWLQSIIIDQLDAVEVQGDATDEHSPKLEYWAQREDISRQLLHLLHAIPEADLEPNGLHLAFKVRDIAVGLLECPYDKNHPAAKRAAEYIQQLTLILARLDRSEQANIVNLQSWIDTDRIRQNRTTTVLPPPAARAGYSSRSLGLPMTPHMD